MTKRSHYHCQRCGTTFESAVAMKDHTRKEHMDQADGGDGTSVTAQAEPTVTRKNKEFTRSHRE
jgi:hypothetical protein